jgi:hypothetical protein
VGVDFKDGERGEGGAKRLEETVWHEGDAERQCCDGGSELREDGV